MNIKLQYSWEGANWLLLVSGIHEDIEKFHFGLFNWGASGGFRFYKDEYGNKIGYLTEGIKWIREDVAEILTSKEKLERYYFRIAQLQIEQCFLNIYNGESERIIRMRWRITKKRCQEFADKMMSQIEFNGDKKMQKDPIFYRTRTNERCNNEARIKPFQN